MDGKGEKDEDDEDLLDNPKVPDTNRADLKDIPNIRPNVAIASGPSVAGAFINSSNPILDAEREALEEKIADGQINESDLTDAQKTLLGRNSTNAQQQDPTKRRKSINNIEKNRRQSRFAKGAKAVGKKIVKPVWDFDKGTDAKANVKYNSKRLAKNVIKGAGRFGLGMATVAAQAGISITDGKYNPMEGIAAYSAGRAGANKIAGALGSIKETYVQGAIQGDEKEQMKRAQEKFGERDDVIEFNKKNYAGKEKKMMKRQQDNYFGAGIRDLNEMKSGITFANSLMKNNPNLTEEQADKAAVATMNFEKYLKDIGQTKAITDSDAREKFIQTSLKDVPDTEKAKERKRLENGLDAVFAYKEANKK